MDIIHILTIILVVTTCAFSLYMVRKVRIKISDFENTIKENQASNHADISFNRAQLENIVYDTNNRLTATGLSFGNLTHILIDASKNDVVSKDKVYDLSYYEQLGIDIKELKINADQATLLMPFNKRYNKIYRHIKETCQDNGFECIRTDEEKIESNNNLRKFIVEQILKAKVVIAVLDGRNANVFYEVGIAHAMGKLVILVASLNDDVPIDIKANRIVFYNSPTDLKEKLSNCLEVIKDA